MKILAADTSAKTASVALADENGVIAEFNLQSGLTHSQTLMPMLDSLLKISGVTLCQIDGFACSNGPGSFTGLRIGIGAIKGLAYGLDKPCIGVSTLNALAHNLILNEGIICAVMDARCNQVYNAVFEASGNKLTQLVDDNASSIDELYFVLEKYKKTIYLVGDGANICYNSFKNKSENIFMANELVRFQHAASVALIAARQLLADSDGDYSPDLLNAAYLRLPQAERELSAKRKD